MVTLPPFELLDVYSKHLEETLLTSIAVATNSLENIVSPVVLIIYSFGRVEIRKVLAYLTV